MHSVFGLLEDDGLGGFHDGVGDFEASFGGEAVHEHGVIPPGGLKEFLGYLEGLKVFLSLFKFIFFAH